jgi:hypothetical protein
MAHTTGTATDYHDLLIKLKTWLITQGWTQELYTAAGSITAQAKLIMRAPGGGANRRPYCMFRTFANSSAPYYSIEMRIASNYDSGLGYDSQLEISPPVYLSSSNASMTYWFYANSRRVIIVTKIGTSYVSAYAGMYLPFALASEQERPFYVAGNTSDVTMQASSNSYLNNFIADPGQNCGYILDKFLNWRNMHNRDATGASDASVYTSDNGSCCLWPMKCAPSASNTTTGTCSWNAWGFAALRPNVSGEMPMFQCHVVDPAANANYGSLLGALDGVYAIPGFNRTTEQVIDLDGQDYRVFQNGIRSSLNHFMAILEV